MRKQTCPSSEKNGLSSSVAGEPFSERLLLFSVPEEEAVGECGGFSEDSGKLFTLTSCGDKPVTLLAGEADHSGDELAAMTMDTVPSGIGCVGR